MSKGEFCINNVMIVEREAESVCNVHVDGETLKVAASGIHDGMLKPTLTTTRRTSRFTVQLD